MRQAKHKVAGSSPAGGTLCQALKAISFEGLVFSGKSRLGFLGNDGTIPPTAAGPITLLASLKTLGLRLWNEEQHRLVGFGSLKTLSAGA